MVFEILKYSHVIFFRYLDIKLLFPQSAKKNLSVWKVLFIVGCVNWVINNVMIRFIIIFDRYNAINQFNEY